MPAEPGATLTRGQLAAFASEAAKEMETKLRAIPLTEGGAGSAIRAMQPVWQAQVGAGDAKEPTTLAQAKMIAGLFQARMAAALAAKNSGRPGAVTRTPDSPTVPAEERKRITLAQWHDLMFFDLDNFDADDDGKTYAMEISGGTDPFDPYNGLEPNIEVVEGAGQTGLPGYFLPYPLTVWITGPNGSIFVNSRVTFSVPPGDPSSLSVKADGSTSLVKTITVRTDGLGYAWVYLKLGTVSDVVKSNIRVTTP